MQLQDLTERLVGLVSDHYEREFHRKPSPALTAASRFADLGMDNLDFMQISDAIEDELDVAVAHTLEFRHYSVGELAAVIATA